MATTKKTETTKSVIDTHNVATAAEIEQMLKLQLNRIWNDPKSISRLRPFLIHGSPGIGKSTIVRSVCEELGIDFIDCRLSQMEPCDIRGLPVPNKEKCQMDWYVNGVWPRDQKGRGIIFLDEITSADKSIQVAAYELILDRRLGKLYSVPPGYLIVSAGNTVTDRAVATTMSSALANRLTHVELQVDSQDWLTWARHHDIHPSVVGFIQYLPNMLFKMDGENLERGWPSPRSWEAVSEVCHMGIDKELMRRMVYGLVGNGAGTEFMAFHELNSEFANIRDVMLDPESKIVIPKEADRIYAMCSAMVYLLWRGKSKAEQDALLNGFFRICIELTSDFSSMALYAAMEGLSKDDETDYADIIITHPLYKKWREKHKDALMRHMQARD